MLKRRARDRWTYGGRDEARTNEEDLVGFDLCVLGTRCCVQHIAYILKSNAGLIVFK